MNIYEYIEKYGNKTFEEKEFNEVDNLIFSLLSYLDFSELENKTIEDSYKEYKKIYKEIKKLGTCTKDAYLCLEKMHKTKRYKNIKISNYIYLGTKEEQFSAVTFIINKKLKYVSFEGTDHLLSGWKEDLELSYQYPVLSQIHAKKYLKKTTKLIGPKIIVGGHSKGGNLAQTSAMELNILKKTKIISIYNNDGPGLRYKQFTSRKYKKLEKKLIHIVPKNTIIGIMLRNNKYKVVECKKRAFNAHFISNWIIQDDKVLETNMNKKSIELEKNIIEWLDNHDDIKRKKMIDNVFKIFEKCEITTTSDIKKIKSIIKIIKEVKNVDKETKQLVTDFINYNFL